MSEEIQIDNNTQEEVLVEKLEKTIVIEEKNPGYINNLISFGCGVGLGIAGIVTTAVLTNKRKIVIIKEINE